MTPSSHARAKALFLAALERVPAEREAFLAEACGMDTVLHREVASLLAFHQESVASGQEPPAANDERFAAGEVFERNTKLRTAVVSGATGMAEHVTFLRPDTSPPSSERGLSSALPPDLLEQIRGRVRLLALFLTLGFAIDTVLYFATYGEAALTGVPLPSDFLKRLPFQWANLGAMAASAAVWGATRHRLLTPSRLLTLGLVYEVIICFVIAFGTIWEYYVARHHVPLMTWVNAVVILYPVILPGPPRRMLMAATAAAAMLPFSLVLLDAWNIVPVTPDDFLDALIQGAFSVGLAYMGARVVYGLGREVAKARELGSYRLEEKLGQGGMGEVWRARHRMLARPAAIKLIRRSPAGDTRAGISEDAQRRFEREAQVIASLRSPTPWDSSTSESHKTGRSTTPWSCSRDSTPIPWYGASVPSSPSGPCTCCARSVTR